MSEDNIKIRMLVVDDDPEAVKGIVNLLCRRFECSVDDAEDVAGAMVKLDSNSYEILVLDYQLPDGTGLDLLRHVSDTTGRPCVIIVTGHGDDSIAREAFKLGACGYVVKDSRLNMSLCDAVTCALEG